MNDATVFENLLLINAEINTKYVYPNMDRNRFIRFFYRILVKHYRKALMKRVDQYDHNSFLEMLGFLKCCERANPPKGHYRNIHSIIVMDNTCISSILDEEVNESGFFRFVYTLTVYYSNPTECELVATVVTDEGSNRYIFNMKDDFNTEQVMKYHISAPQKRVLMIVLRRLRSILVEHARMFLREEIHRSERIEL